MIAANISSNPNHPSIQMLSTMGGKIDCDEETFWKAINVMFNEFTIWFFNQKKNAK